MGLRSRFRRALAVLRAPQPVDMRDYASAIDRRINATYDAARTSDELAAYWSNADAFDADSAHDRGTRETLVRRSRYETANNGFSDGIATTYATDLVGKGPQLRMQTGSQAFNQMVEREWFLWSQAVHLRQKLTTMAHAKHVDGEAFAVLRKNPNINHPVKLDVVLHETEQFQTPHLPFGERGRIDGIHFDQFGNVTGYDFLKEHPGSATNYTVDQKPDFIPAQYVAHWFKIRRPGQHRGVPECSSTLNLGACFRRGRISTLLTWEKIAKWTLFLKTLFEPEQIQGCPPFSSFDVSDGMVTNLPNSVEPFQLKAEHPGPTYKDAHRLWVNEQGRPKGMPLNKVLCSSEGSNYASAWLDHQTYDKYLDVDREDGNDQVMEKIFALWFEMAIRAFGWLGGDPEAVGAAARFHIWDWPHHQCLDIEADAKANNIKLRSGQLFLHRLFAEQGLDFEDEIEKAAELMGRDVQEYKDRLFDHLYPPPKQIEAPGAKSPAKPAVPAVEKRMNGHLNGLALNGNGANHG